jgi:secondary thiamine-phosphate synthase enzyme
VETALVTVRTGTRPEVRDISDLCARFIKERVDGADGLLHVFVPHATAGVAVLETGAGSDEDLLRVLLSRLLPRDFDYTHRHGSPGHGRDHLVPAFIAPSISIPVLAGVMALGTWQSVCLIDTNSDNLERRVRLSFLAG